MLQKLKSVKNLSPRKPRKGKSFCFTILGQQTCFQGKIILEGEARLAGRLEGHVVSRDILVIESTGYVEGGIEGVQLEISGEVRGDIKVSDTLRLLPTAKVWGQISAKHLIVEEGAHIQGSIETWGADVAGSEKPTENPSYTAPKSSLQLSES